MSTQLNKLKLNSLNPEIKQRLLDYTKKQLIIGEKKDLIGDKKTSFLGNIYDNYQEKSILEDMVDDLAKRSNRLESREIFEDYIFTLAIKNLKEMLTEEETIGFEAEINENNWYLLLSELLEEKKNWNSFIAGLILGYAKLSYQLQLEPDNRFLSISNVLSNQNLKINY